MRFGKSYLQFNDIKESVNNKRMPQTHKFVFETTKLNAQTKYLLCVKSYM